MKVTEAIGGEIPGIFAEKFRDGSKNAALDEHPSVEVIRTPESRKTLDRQTIENHPPLRGERRPPRNALLTFDTARKPRDFEGDISEFIGPHVSQIFGTRRNRLLENIGAGAQRIEMGTCDG